MRIWKADPSRIATGMIDNGKIVVPVVALGMLALLAFAWGGAATTWVMFGFAMWALSVLLFGGGRRSRRRLRYARWAAMREQQAAPPPPPSPPALAPVPPPAGSLPTDVEQQVDRIRRKAAVLARYRDRFPMGSKDFYVVEHIEADYLGPTLKTYLDVPAWSVNTPAADGRTPLQMLHDQLELLETKLDEIAEGVKKQRVDDLLANERFLEERFGHSDREELTIPRQ